MKNHTTDRLEVVVQLNQHIVRVLTTHNHSRTNRRDLRIRRSQSSQTHSVTQHTTLIITNLTHHSIERRNRRRRIHQHYRHHIRSQTEHSRRKRNRTLHQTLIAVRRNRSSRHLSIHSITEHFVSIHQNHTTMLVTNHQLHVTNTLQHNALLVHLNRLAQRERSHLTTRPVRSIRRLPSLHPSVILPLRRHRNRIRKRKRNRARRSSSRIEMEISNHHSITESHERIDAKRRVLRPLQTSRHRHRVLTSRHASLLNTVLLDTNRIRHARSNRSHFTRSSTNTLNANSRTVALGERQCDHRAHRLLHDPTTHSVLSTSRHHRGSTDTTLRINAQSLRKSRTRRAVHKSLHSTLNVHSIHCSHERIRITLVTNRRRRHRRTHHRE